MRSRHPGAAVLALLLVIPALRADKTDDFINAEMKRQRIPGLSLVVLKDGQIVKAAGYGLANLKLKTPATPDTVYKIASVSKQFIATGIMLLVQEGRLGLDDPISKHFDGTPAAWKAITIRHLLTHSSGLVREAPGFDPMKVQSDADVVRTAYSAPLRFAPGERYEYGNTGYFALAEIIRKASGKPWTEYLNEKVFTPSGMTATFPTNTPANVPNRAQDYVDNDKLLDAPKWLALRPSGAFLSTVLDLAKWDAMLYTDRILTETSRTQMWTPVKLSDGSAAGYGFGWQMGKIKDRRLVYHTGGMPGARSMFARFVDDRLTIIALMNIDDADIDAFMHGLAAIYLAGESGGR